MEVNTKYSKNNKFNKDFNFLQLLKKVQEKFASKFLSQLQQLFNSENNNKLEQTENKKKQQQQKLQQKNPEDALIGYSSVLDILSHNAL